MFAGSDATSGIRVMAHTGTSEIITTSENSPKAASKVVDAKDVNISWLLERVVTTATTKSSGSVSVLDLSVTFDIKRDDVSCHTPRRNDDVARAFGCMIALSGWAQSVAAYFRSSVFPSQALLEKLNLSAIGDGGVFVPVLALMMRGSEENSKGVQVGVSEERALVLEQRRSLESKFAQLSAQFRDDSALVSQSEAKLLSTMAHVQSVCERVCGVADYIESLIEQQLVAAVGKWLTANEFGAYMTFHNRKLFQAQYAPAPFVYAVRRADMSPEGVLSLEADVRDGKLSQPVHTFACTRHAPRNKPLYFALGAASRAAFLGEQTVHALLMHQVVSLID